MAVDKQHSQKIICNDFSTGSCHDFTLFKHTYLAISQDKILKIDLGYQGIQQYHKNSVLPLKHSKHSPLTKADKQANRELASQRALNENVTCCLKRFKIISCRYRNRRKRCGPRFNLIAGICNRLLA